MEEGTKVKVCIEDKIILNISVKFDPNQPGITDDWNLERRGDMILVSREIGIDELLGVLEVLKEKIEVEKK